MRRFPLRVAPASAGSFRATIGMPDPVACVPAAASSGGAGNMGGTDDIGNHEDDGAGTLIDLPFTVKLYSLKNSNKSANSFCGKRDGMRSSSLRSNSPPLR